MATSMTVMILHLPVGDPHGDSLNDLLHGPVGDPHGDELLCWPVDDPYGDDLNELLLGPVGDPQGDEPVRRLVDDPRDDIINLTSKNPQEYLFVRLVCFVVALFDLSFFKPRCGIG
jgi:hypothetical protein